MMTIRCCKDCRDRYVGCHGKCEKYKSESAAFEEARAIRKKIATLYLGPEWRTPRTAAFVRSLNKFYGRKR